MTTHSCGQARTPCSSCRACRPVRATYELRRPGQPVLVVRICDHCDGPAARQRAPRAAT